jgi:hypothetical protein
MRMLKFASMFVLASMLLLSLSYAQTGGYGTSSITLSQYSVYLVNGGITNVNYSVNLVSGNTWGTKLTVTNGKALLSDGVSTTLSKNYSNPTYTGVLTINVAQSAPKGTYQIILNATGDDPSTNVTILTLTVAAPGNTTTIQNVIKTNATTTTATTVPTTTAPLPPSNTLASGFYGLTEAQALLLFGIIASIVAAGILMFVFKGGPARLAVWGVVLIIIGTIIWLYGDFMYGNTTYIWTGVGVLLLGVLVWLVGDGMGGAFKKFGLQTALLALGVILILAGTAVWLYADLSLYGNMAYIWSGVGIIAFGTIIWLAGNAIGGAFKRSARK